MKGPWVKIWRTILTDEKLGVLIKKHGDKAFRIWITLLLRAEDGTVTDESCILELITQTKTLKLKIILDEMVELKMIVIEKEQILIPKWDKYQDGRSTHRTRAFRERQGNAKGTQKERVEDRSKKIEVRSKETIQRKKERSIKPTEGKYGEFKNVLLDQSYVDKMFRQYGQDQLDAMISMLSTWKEAKHKSLLTDNAGALSGWVKREYKPVPIPKEAPHG